MSETTRTILITGASRGIGRAVAVLCGARGWAVGVNYHSNKAAADETVAAVEAAGGKAVAIPGDVANEDDVIAMFDAVEAAFGPLDGVVNNAGVLDIHMPLADMSLERIRRVIDTNVVGALMVARETARRMSTSRGGKGGALVNLSSMAATLGAPREYVDYATSKGAIDTLTVGLGRELAREGVRVNGVRPGLIETDIHASGGDADRAERLGVKSPMGRPGRPDEVAEAIVWLLSDAASYVTATTFDVSGGR